MAIEFPTRLVREQSHDWNIVGNTMGVGQTNVASVDVRSDGGGFWVASLNEIQLDDLHARLWRAVRQICNGGVTPIVVPRNDVLFAPWPNGVTTAGVIPFSDESLFDDDSGFYQPIIDVSCRGAVALRATTMEINLNYCGALQGGESFTIDHAVFGPRLYEIGTVVVAEDEATAVITFNPPLREAISDETTLDFDRPRCLMKLQSAGAMDLNVTPPPFSTASVKFVESKYGA